jgi:hypothetical protein
MLFRKYAPAAAAAFVAFALFLLWLWQPERQVRLHTSHFLKKVERRNWDDARNFLAPDYSDRWTHDRDSAVADLREAFRSFLFVTIENRTDSCELHGDRGTTRTVLKISGNGGPVAHLIMERVNGLHGPFTFDWRKASWKPWDWELTGVEHPELRTERYEGF